MFIRRVQLVVLFQWFLCMDCVFSQLVKELSVFWMLALCAWCLTVYSVGLVGMFSIRSIGIVLFVSFGFKDHSLIMIVLCI